MSGRQCLVTSCNKCRACLTPEVKLTVQTHKVSTDALDTLGTIIDESCGRDAIHLAVENVIAAHDMPPGTHVSLKDGVARASGRTVGIVDPFLQANVKGGQRFWLVVYPRQITSLRHVWEHPDFPTSPDAVTTVQKPKEPTQAEISEEWIRDYAITTPISYDRLMEAAAEYVKHGQYLSMGPLLESEYVPQEFWPHYENVTGNKVPDEDKHSFFSCSC